MHELALTEGILKIVLSEQKKNAFTRVLEIDLKIGEYSGIIPSCIEEFFPLVAKDTPAEGAELVMFEKMSSANRLPSWVTAPMRRRSERRSRPEMSLPS